MSTELDDLVATLPGNVWTTDAAAAMIHVDHNLLRFAALGSDTPANHRWLDAIHPDDLTNGALLWRPMTSASPVSTTSFRLKPDRGHDLSLRVLVAQAPADAGAGRHWIGTFFLDTAHRSAAEHVAIAILERIAALAGSTEPRPATLGPAALPDVPRGEVSTSRHLVAIVGCAAEPGEALEMLFEILGWRSVVVDRVTAELVLATRLTIVGKLSLIPSEIVQPYSNRPAIAVLCREEDGDNRAAAAGLGCGILDIPVDLTAIEQLVVALT